MEKRIFQVNYVSIEVVCNNSTVVAVYDSIFQCKVEISVDGYLKIARILKITRFLMRLNKKRYLDFII